MESIESLSGTLAGAFTGGTATLKVAHISGD